ncbi:MAG: translocation/assembly module TamB domain-containing protein [bacterium]
MGKNIVNFNVNITNLMPTKINTGIADLDINSDLNLQFLMSDGCLFNPELMGSLIIDKGILDFLQHKLFIDYGKIQFIPNRLNDPIVDLIAKNKINKYLVTLHVTGSLNNPKIMLESFPKLNKKQILALLVAGSKDANFKAQITQILQKNLGQLNSKNSLLKKLTQPFKFVQITPSFATQTSRGGLKGSLDVDLNDQVHASVQKNFNLQDDLSFQVDYFVTDDINIQFLKDQRGELGAQVEVILTL